MGKPVIVIHGGAGALARNVMTSEREQLYRQGLTQIIANGQRLLSEGKSAVDVVTEAVLLLEENPLFNAGYGSVFTHDQTHELDACIMDGQTLAAGSVCSVSHIRNPVCAARAVMEKSPHVMMSGKGAELFAQKQGLTMVEPDFFSTETRFQQLIRIRGDACMSMKAVLDHDGQRMSCAKPAAVSTSDPLDSDTKYGTVGAVVLDANGHLAAATSTGGMTNKMVGRVGDSPIIGAGCYANNQTAALSSTGTGEAFMQTVAAYDVSALMEYAGLSLNDAMNRVVMEKLPPIDGSGGMIGVDAQGNIALPFNSEGMYRGYGYVDDTPWVGIYRDETD